MSFLYLLIIPTKGNKKRLFKIWRYYKWKKMNACTFRMRFNFGRNKLLTRWIDGYSGISLRSWLKSNMRRKRAADTSDLDKAIFVYISSKNSQGDWMNIYSRLTDDQTLNEIYERLIASRWTRYCRERASYWLWLHPSIVEKSFFLRLVLR